jgi:hypothetical protein
MPTNLSGQCPKLVGVSRMVILSDARITELLADPKPVAPREVRKLKQRLRLASRNQLTAQVSIKSTGRRNFRIAVRKDPSRPKNFSVRLAFFIRKRWVNLIRCNGHHTLHVNELESRTKVRVQRIPENTFHIHQATERYQTFGKDAESYAEPTDRYETFEGAVEFLCSHFGCFNSEEPGQLLLPFLD